ncbi:MAG: hypothetical protein K0S47_3153, partial [Herbinix sp.]|nr:hypothetical protein [Herbinix sp.]
TLVPLAVMKESNTDYKAINASFLPVGMVGLNSASKEAEIAKKFIMFLFSEEVQDGDLYDGFPINKNSLSKWMEKESTETFAFSSDGVMLDGVYPDKEVREGIINVIQEVNTPIVLNQEVINIMIHEVLPYLAGEIDLEQAAAAAATKINTYLAE